jgi:hypothetical protein
MTMRTGLRVIIKPADAQGTGMAGTDGPALAVGCGAGCAAIGRDVADCQRLAAVLGDGSGWRWPSRTIGTRVPR